MKHLDFDQMMAAAEGAGGPQPAHLTGCRSCTEEVDGWRRVLASARADRGEPSARAVAAAHRLFAPTGLAATVAGVARWIAELTFDSGGLAPAVAGARGAPQGTRQLLFTAAGIELDLAYPTDSGPKPVRGQAVASGDGTEQRAVAWRPLTLTATDAARSTQMTSTDGDGGFHFDHIEPGTYELQLELENGTVVARIALD